MHFPSNLELDVKLTSLIGLAHLIKDFVLLNAPGLFGLFVHRAWFYFPLSLWDVLFGWPIPLSIVSQSEAAFFHPRSLFLFIVTVDRPFIWLAI